MHTMAKPEIRTNALQSYSDTLFITVWGRKIILHISMPAPDLIFVPTQIYFQQKWLHSWINSYQDKHYHLNLISLYYNYWSFSLFHISPTFYKLYSIHLWIRMNQTTFFGFWVWKRRVLGGWFEGPSWWNHWV